MLAVRTTASPSDADRLTYTVPLSGLAKSRRARVSLPRCSADGRRIIQNTLKAVRPSIATPLNAPVDIAQCMVARGLLTKASVAFVHIVLGPA